MNTDELRMAKSTSMISQLAIRNSPLNLLRRRIQRQLHRLTTGQR